MSDGSAEIIHLLLEHHADPKAIADLAMALLDGAGIRALISDPAMDVDAARRLVAERLAAELGLEPNSLL